MASEGPPLTLTLGSDLRYVAVARAFVEAVCKAAGLDAPTTHAVVLATHEAVSNVVRHAHQGRPEAPLQICCRLGDDAIEVCVLDEGAPFDVDGVPRLNPAEVRPGGRGIYLMRSVMDEVTSQPRGTCGNTVRMVKHYRGRYS